MPVDEANLEVVKDDLRSKLNANSLERANLKKLLGTANNISEDVVPDPTADEPARTKKVMPQDRGLGTTMSTARRNSIYDNLVSEHGAL